MIIQHRDTETQSFNRLEEKGLWEESKKKDLCVSVSLCLK